MACEEWRGKLDLYVDGELAPAEAATAGKHFRECPSCAFDVLERVQLKRSVQMAGARYKPSPDFRANITATITKSVARKSRRGIAARWRLALIPVLILLLAAFLFNFYRGRERTRQRIYSELADLHVTTLASTTLVDVVSSDRHTVKPWFQGKIPFTF